MLFLPIGENRHLCSTGRTRAKNRRKMRESCLKVMRTTPCSQSLCRGTVLHVAAEVSRRLPRTKFDRADSKFQVHAACTQSSFEMAKRNASVQWKPWFQAETFE